MRILLTNIYVTDPNKAHDFYTEILEFISVVHMPDENLAIIASEDDPDGTGLLLEPNENPIAKEYQKKLFNAGLPAIVFGTVDIQAEYTRLLKLGVKFTKEPTETAWGIESIFDDGFGNLVQIFQNV